MTTVSGISGTSLWLTDAWASYRSQSRSMGPSIQDFLDQGAALADSLATISQNRTTGFGSLALQSAQNRVQAAIKALLQQQAAEAAASAPSSGQTTGSSTGAVVNVTV